MTKSAPTPRVSVLMTTHNGVRTIGESIASNRIAVADGRTMVHLRSIIRRVADGLVERRPSDRLIIADGVRYVLWRLTRAAVRSGHPFLFCPPAPPADAAVSLAVGAMRAGLRWRAKA